MRRTLTPPPARDAVRCRFPHRRASVALLWVLVATSAGNVFRILRLAGFAGAVAGIAPRVTAYDSTTVFANAVGRISTLGNAARQIAAFSSYVRAELVIACLIAVAISASRTTIRTGSAGTASRILSLATSAGTPSRMLSLATSADTASCIATFAALAEVAIRDIAAWRTALACCWIRGTLPRAPRSAARAIGTSAPCPRVNTAGTTSTLITSFATNRTYALRATACAFTSTTGALTCTAVL